MKRSFMQSAGGFYGRVVAAALVTLLPVPSWAGTSSPVNLGGILPYALGLMVLIVLGFRFRFARFAALVWFAAPLVFLLISEEMDGRAKANIQLKPRPGAESGAEEPANSAAKTTPPQERR